MSAKIIAFQDYTPAPAKAREISEVATNKATSAKEMADSVFSMIRCCEHSIRSAARTWGITDAEALALYLDGDARHEQRALQAAYRAGRLSVLPPVPMRRVA